MPQSIMKVDSVHYELLIFALYSELINNFVPKMARVVMGINYYPTCPDPSLTLGLSAHSDVSCLTILHPSEVPGLQIKHKGDWVSVRPINESAFVVNIADQVEVCICKIYLHHIGSRHFIVN